VPDGYFESNLSLLIDSPAARSYDYPERVKLSPKVEPDPFAPSQQCERRSSASIVGLL
jgi:hypothetical protein